MTDTTNTQSGYTITRVMEAPRELVWKCWTDPAEFAVWFGGHEGRMDDMVIDARPGGRWSGTMVLPDGTNLGWSGEYLEVQEPERLVLAFTVDTEAITSFENFTVTLTDLGDKTEMVVRQSGGNLTDEQYLEAKQGTSEFFDVMAEHLASR
jgi:uncharacterized protein YndB with AHSA1/START domain